MPDITINGYVTHYGDDDFTDPWKPRQTIVIQHGFGRNSQFWRRWVPMLAGDTRDPARPARARRLGRSGAERSVVVRRARPRSRRLLRRARSRGRSSAGRIDGRDAGRGLRGARAAAWSRRGAARSLTLCATPKTIGPAAQSFSLWPRVVAGGADGDGLGGLGARAASRPGTFPSSDPAQIEWAIKQFGRASAASLTGYCTVISTRTSRRCCPGESAGAELAPTRSAATSIEEQESIAAALPQSELVQIDGAGHEIYIDRADDCVAALRDFLAGFQ